ncbi:MAG: hypothetical protein ACKVT2_22715 [Saprospiraceae bacterium]
MFFLFILIYLLFCLLVAFAASRSRLGFVGALILSVIITPLLTAIFVSLYDKRKIKRKVIQQEQESPEL